MSNMPSDLPCGFPRNLPRGFLTLSPLFLDDSLPAECLALLPSGGGSLGLLEDLAAQPWATNGRGIGLFMSDPFLNVTHILNFCLTHQIKWLANLPSVAQHDESFRRDLAEVGFSVEAELAKLHKFRRQGLLTLAAISSVEDAAILTKYPADAVVVVQTTAELQVSFPSIAQRLSRTELVNQALLQQGLTTPAVPVITGDEAIRTDISAILRPRPLVITEPCRPD